MDLLQIIEPAPTALLGVAHLPPSTSEASLLARAPEWLTRAGIAPALTHPRRRVEWLAGRILATELLAQLTNEAAELLIQTDEFGRPHLQALTGARAGAVSLTHGGEYIAALVALGPTRRAGLDLEPERPKALALAPRWLTSEELSAVGAEPARAALAWSLKETLYKLYGRRQLDFRQHLHLDLSGWPPPGTPLPATGTLPGRITRPAAVPHGWTHQLRYERAVPHCWLSYCVGTAN